ncbi:hypothetical protein FDP41_009302 [Naegleria fowleri]|uniref:Costars domain-containing protein n=1 Tax=Naegleria fowleri TaxID=5763 RepID=A0A6A5BHA8_NAEFO|nr:uncharacterized protein FDP41_009302 [Naegleria fowleri]KAF0972399.1 hypothetical protein FDP41_009302 [Naegleria fowleri]
MSGYNVEKEIEHLVHEMKRIGGSSGTCTFGQLFHDDKIQNLLESLVGTMKAAKKRKVIDFQGELLLQGVHDKVEVKLLQPDFKASQ